MLQQLAAHLSQDPSAGDLVKARLHLLDWIGCAVAGRNHGTASALMAALKEEEVREVFAWGALGNILEMDDVDKRALLHPGPSIIPAALCALSDTGSLDDLLTAVVRGYEATVRLGRAVGPDHYAFWHNTGTCGPIGAAAAAASLLKLSREETGHAMALAMSQFAGLWQTRHDPESAGKQIHTAHAAQAGLVSARLAARGLQGPLSFLEGEQGFFAATCGAADPMGVLANHDGRWLIQDVSFKPWAACRHAHAVIDAALLAREAVPLDKIEQVIILTYADALKFCDKPNPQTVIEAKFSLQHAVAVTLVKGMPQLSDFEPDAIADPAIADLRGRVQVYEGDAYTSRYPAHFGAEVRLEAGEKSGVYRMPDALGDPENPLSQDGIERKARTLFEYGGLDTMTADRLIGACMMADGASSAQDLVSLVRQALTT